MTTDETLTQTCRSLAATGRRAADLIASAPDLSVAAHHSEWTLQQVGAHLTAVAGFFTELANGVPSFVSSMDRTYIRTEAERHMADIPESDPTKLSRLLLDAIDEFLDATSDRPGDHPVTFHAGMPYTLAGASGVFLGEMILHGYDMATALRAPWPIDPTDAALVLGAYTPVFALTTHPERTRGLSTAFGVELRGVGAMTVRFTEGAFSVEEPGAPVNATVSAEPIAFLLVGSGRLDPFEAIALGLLDGSPRPDLALGFFDLFVFP